MKKPLQLRPLDGRGPEPGCPEVAPRRTAGWTAAVLACCLLAAAWPAAGAEAAGDLQVTYVGNEGFLLAGGGRKVLIDALYRDGVRGYHVVSGKTRSLAEGARAPFDGVDLILATHHHADHFDAESVMAHLTANPKAIFVSTFQARAELERHLASNPDLRKRIRSLNPEEGKPETMEVNGIRLTVLNLHHGRERPVQNLGFIVELNGRKALHVGDTEATAAEFGMYGLVERKISVVFLPLWQLRHETWDGSAEAIGAGQIVIMHVPNAELPDPEVEKMGGWQAAVDSVKATRPDTISFSGELETRTFRPDVSSLVPAKGTPP